jgi:hypothetical protein
MSDEKQLYEILVPCNWNDGAPVRTKHHKEWDKRVRKIAEGLTILKPGKGTWVHQGEIHEDRVIPVRVHATQRQMERIANITIQHYEQEAVMYYPVAPWALIHNATDQQRAAFTRPKDRIARRIADDHSTLK